MASAARRRIDDRLVLEAAGRLTERDRYLCRLLLDHQVLTTEQIRQVAFDSIRRAQLRLSQLQQLRVLDSFRPLARIGSFPQHWMLDTLGATILAAERGVDPSELPWRRDKSVALATSAQLAHTVGTNGFFCSLLATTRALPEAELRLWWSARRCAGAWGSFVRPDGYGVWTQAGRRAAFLLEFDTGTETTARLAEKLDRYARLFAATGRSLPVLFSFPGPGREAEARRALRHPAVPVFTATIRAGASPADPVWLPTLGSGTGRRLRLVDLGADRGTGGGEA
ncbi:MAG TPA: replication-relaxation family protein [Acidimicrobiales bacterium]|nr:replication-relaxation family protein [Acidimicrobiales bacterium]